MSQDKEQNLEGLGIELPSKLLGDLRILRAEKGLPTVFLIDENHDNLNNCIDKNIENATELINKVQVVLVGVESWAGGKSWDPEDQIYSETYSNKKMDDYYAKQYKSDKAKFVNELKNNHSNLIYGVESFGMMHRIGEDFMEGNLYYGTEVSDHPLHKSRSAHFIKTLFENYNYENLKGNLILNCGSNHNTHIEEWVSNGEIDSIANFKANYVRINTIE